MIASRRRRAFTLAELAIVLSVLAIVTPLAWATVRRVEGRAEDALWRIQVADSAGTVAGSLAQDGRRGSFDPQTLTWLVDGCAVRYRVEDGALSRGGVDDCATEQVLARDVEALEPEDGGLRLIFARTVRPGETQTVELFLPVEGL